MRHSSPTVHKGPRPSMVNPTSRVTAPTAGTSAAPRTAASRRSRPSRPPRTPASAGNAHHLRQLFRDAVQPGFHPGVQVPEVGFDEASAPLEAVVGYPHHLGPAVQPAGQLA